MKKTLIPFLAALLILGFQSCKEEVDKCVDMYCYFDGKCVDGKCNCPEGFSGDSCQVTPTCDPGREGNFCEFESRSKFLGSFTVTWVCSDSITRKSPDKAYISAYSNDITQIRISKVYGDAGVIATVNGQHLTIGQSLASDTTITGTGFCEGNNKSVSISYKVTTTGGVTDSCTIVYVR